MASKLSLFLAELKRGRGWALIPTCLESPSLRGPHPQGREALNYHSRWYRGWGRIMPSRRGTHLSPVAVLPSE